MAVSFCLNRPAGAAFLEFFFDYAHQNRKTYPYPQSAPPSLFFLRSRTPSMTTLALLSLDRQLLAFLQEDPRMSLATLAEKANSSISPCWRRVKRMEEAGLIRGYRMELDRRALGLGIDGYLFVKIASHHETQALEFERALAPIEQVLSCQILSGQEDYLLRVVERDLDSFALFMRKVIAGLPHVREVRSMLIMQTVKESGRLPLL
jgi:Lrp/AsnC family leucine-responsive transcriptional regulator